MVVGIDLVHDLLFGAGHLVVIETANLGFAFMYHVADPYGSMTLGVGIAEALNHDNLVRFYVSDIAYVINIEKLDEAVNLFLILFSFGLALVFVRPPASMVLQPVFYSFDVFASAVFEVEHEDGFFFVDLTWRSLRTSYGVYPSSYGVYPSHPGTVISFPAVVEHWSQVQSLLLEWD